MIRIGRAKRPTKVCIICGPAEAAVGLDCTNQIPHDAEPGQARPILRPKCSGRGGEFVGNLVFFFK